VVLGTDLALTKSFLDRQFQKHTAYFDLLDSLGLHPQLAFTLLRICGTPRIKYLLSVSPPSYVSELASYFDARVVESLEKIMGATIDKQTIHDRLGAGIPAYAPYAVALYNSSKNEVLNRIRTSVELVTNELTSFTAPHNHDANWMYYDGLLTPCDFINALAIRLSILPPHLRLHPCRCNCGHVVRCDAEQIHHTFICDQFTAFGHTTRHNLVRDTMITVANSFGITVTKEPNHYVYPFGKKRPDILFRTSLGIATDVSIVSPTGAPGIALKEAERVKIRDHSAIVANQQDLFIPAVFEVYGLFGQGFVNLSRNLAGSLPPVMATEFERELKHQISFALAKGRSSALISAKWKQSNRIA
jgi:hypothetical protein